MSEESVIGKFFGVLGFKVDHKGVDEFKGSLEHMKHSVEGMKHALEGLFAIAIIERAVEFVERSIESAAAINDLGEITEMSAVKIAALGRVAVENSSSVDAMKTAILSVYQATGQAAMGIGRNVKLFQALGIHAKDATGKVKGADEIMTELAGKFEKMDMPKVIAAAGRLGIDPMIAKTMKEMGAEGWRKEVQGAMGRGLLSESDYREADKTEIAFNKLHGLISGLSALIATQLSPWIRSAVASIGAFVSGNKAEIIERIHGAMKALARALHVLWQGFSAVYSILVGVYKFFEKNVIAGQALRAVLAAIVAIKVAEYVRSIMMAVIGLEAAIASLGKSLKLSVMPLAFLVMGAALLVQDWMAFKRGEESVFKHLNEKWPGAIDFIEKAIRRVRAVFDDIANTSRAIVDGIEDAARALGIMDEKPIEVESPKPMEVGSPEHLQSLENQRVIAEGKAHMAGLEELAKDPTGGRPWYENLKDRLLGGGMNDLEQSMSELTRLHRAVEAQKAEDAAAAASPFRSSPLAGSSEAPAGYYQPAGPMSIGAVVADRARGREGTTIVNVTGTKVEVKADTDARARTAGASVKDALASQKLRNYQARAR